MALAESSDDNDIMKWMLMQITVIKPSQQIFQMLAISDTTD